MNRVSVVQRVHRHDQKPVVGANTAELKTSAVTELMPFWVRVTNACGTYDSLTAFAIPR